MHKYLIILLDDISTSYCNYENTRTDSRLIPLEVLREGVFYAMAENLTVQFVYPSFKLPSEYEQLIESVHHVKIVPFDSPYSGDVVVVDWDKADGTFVDASSYVVRATMLEFLSDTGHVLKLLDKTQRINIVIKDLIFQSEEQLKKYHEALTGLSEQLSKCFDPSRMPQLNVITDRMMLNSMNNCNAGWENITLAPDGKFYVCPAFYQHGLYSIGDITEGLDIKNPQLYTLKYAPLCRKCDAYQCKRCIWLNQMTTREVNTPSHEQCVAAHYERNVSRNFMKLLRDRGYVLHCDDICEIDYLDPIEARK